jgi:hypothetical protein
MGGRGGEEKGEQEKGGQGPEKATHGGERVDGEANEDFRLTY